MLMSRLDITSRTRDERGFTLIETLVAILTGVVVTGALFAILEISLRQTTRINDVVQANQFGRIAMTHVVDELHSACIAPAFTPVQSASTPSELWLVNAYSQKSVILKTEAFEHRLYYNESAQTLTDYTYAASGGEWPNFTFPATPTSTALLAEHVTKGEGNPAVFRYYKYGTKASGTSETPEATLETVEPVKAGGKLESLAATVSSVNVTFKAGPTESRTFVGHVPAEFSNQTTLSFTSPASENKVSGAPCE